MIISTCVYIYTYKYYRPKQVVPKTCWKKHASYVYIPHLLVTCEIANQPQINPNHMHSEKDNHPTQRELDIIYARRIYIYIYMCTLYIQI